jgi:hypothetical protein
MTWTTRIRFLAGQKIFLLASASRPALKPVQALSNGYRRPFLRGIKRPGREADHSLPSSAEVKKIWSYTSITPHVSMTWCLISSRNNFNFTFTDIKCMITHAVVHRANQHYRHRCVGKENIFFVFLYSRAICIKMLKIKFLHFNEGDC